MAVPAKKKQVIVNTKITHKRGPYNEHILSTLKDGELFYDVTGEHGIFIGQANLKTNKIDIIKLTGAGGGITPEQWELLVKKTDIVREIDTEKIYDINQVLAANEGKNLKKSVNGALTRIDRLEKIFEEEIGDIIAEKVTEIFNKMAGSESIEINIDPSTGIPKLQVRSDATLSTDGGALGVAWVSYSK